MKKSSLMDAIRNKRNKTINIKIELEPENEGMETPEESPAVVADGEKQDAEKQEDVGLAPEVKDRKPSSGDMSPEDLGLLSEEDMMAAEAMEKEGKEPGTIEERMAFEQMVKRKQKGK